MLEPKAIHRRIEAMLDGVPPSATGRAFGERLVADLVAQLALPAAQLYERRDGAVRLLRHCGAERPDLSAELAQRLGAEGDVQELPWAGRSGAGPTAWFELGTDTRPLVALYFDEEDGAGPSPGAMLAIASPLQYATLHHRRRRELEDLIEQARAIQLSLLPAAPPAFGDFDLAAASVPAHVVGGDFYDWIPVDPETLGLTVADASGHGLPAALQARDVATGLRMGVERDFKITRMVEKLNRVIHRSGLVTRFISMVFGELERNGNLSYINAGHPPPLLLDDTGLHALTVGGMLLGPDPAATYKLGFAHVDRGAALVLYSDGVVERGTARGDAFGEERLGAWLAEWRGGPSADAVADLLARLRRHGDGGAFEDDVTVMLVRRPR